MNSKNQIYILSIACLTFLIPPLVLGHANAYHEVSISHGIEHFLIYALFPVLLSLLLFTSKHYLEKNVFRFNK